MEKERTKIIKSSPKLYNVWRNIKYRCNCKTCKMYKHYGGRGIKLCNEWSNNYESFYNWSMNNGYQEGLSIDRINVNGDYEPSNCRWATQEEQANNTTKNIYIDYKGNKKTISQIAKENGFRPSMLYYRLSKGLSVEEALELGKVKAGYNVQKYIYNNKEYTLKELAFKLKIPYSTLYAGLIRKSKKYEGIVKK